MTNQRINISIDRLNIRLKGVTPQAAREAVNGLGNRLAEQLTVDAAGNVTPREGTINRPASLQDRVVSQIVGSIDEKK